MSKWKLEVNDDGDEVLIFDESHSLVTWNLEDTDKCCYEILYLIVAAPELLEVLEQALEDYQHTGQILDNTISKMQKEVALAKNEIPFDPPPDQVEIDIDWTTI